MADKLEYQVIVTNNGLDKLEEAMATGIPLVIETMGFGDAFEEEYIPVVTQEDLKHKILEKPIVEAISAEGVVRYRSVLLSTDPSGNFIELGLYLNDGTLFAVANIPRLEHRQALTGAVTETDVTMILVAENAQNVTINVSSDLYVTKDYANTYYLRVDGNNNVTSNLSMNNNKLTNIKEGTQDSDAATIKQTRNIGDVYLYAGVHTPDDAKECDGIAYSRLGNTAALYKVIGTLYGRGDGSMTFNVPKLDPPFPDYPNIRYVIKYKK